MRVLLARLVAFLLLAASVVAWTKDDYEIFDLVSALKADGDASFYSFLKIESSATQAQIAKAYRKRSLELHPDKNPGVAGIQERFARLGLINSILRDPERRERYNFFYKNGVPTWKGFGYAYTRWRPGLGLVLAFIVLLSAGMHYLIMVMNYRRDTQRVAYFTGAAQKAVRGAAGRRKVRVPMVEGTVGGENLELVVEDGNVYLPHDDGTLWSLDELAPKPSVARTWPVALARSFLSGNKNKAAVEPADEAEGDVRPDVSQSDLEVEGYNVDASAPARGSRAAQLRRERQKKPSKKARADSGSATPSGTGTEGESEADGSAAETTDAADDEKPQVRRRGPGKANAARRRKLNK